MKFFLKLVLWISLTNITLISSISIAKASQKCKTIPGYVTTCDGTIVRTNNPRTGINECWHTKRWKPEMAVIGCDGKTDGVVEPAPFIIEPPSQKEVVMEDPPLAEPELQPEPVPILEPAPIPEPVPEPIAPPKLRVEQITLDIDTLFAFNKSKLSHAGRLKLDELSIEIKNQFSQVDSIVVTGHADRIGSNSYNMRLSRRRAAAVRNYLINSQVVTLEHIEVQAKGESEPVKDCSHISSRRRKRLIQCLAPNRRVIVEVTGLSIPQEVQQ